ncbi:unnamed protein product [Schistosoma turkestanicum]|nr:unnamed protein product [Schistosoma turkestanicum]
MSQSLPSVEELHKLKLSDLKKLCKENKLPSTGTKVELISRIAEMHGNKFVLLQPGDEAELLGDDEDGDSNHVNLSHSTTTTTTTTTTASAMDCTNGDTSSPSSLNFSVTSATKTVARKRPASELTPEKDTMTTGEKVLKITHTTDDTHVNAKEEITNISDSERLICRTKRFMSDDEKTLARAKRFGLPISNDVSTVSLNNTSKLDELEKLKKRAERFGLTTSKTLEKLTDLERKAKRLEKFGKPLSSGNTQMNDELAKSLRAQKFGLVLSSNNTTTTTNNNNNSMSDAEKLSKRQARFGLLASWKQEWFKHIETNLRFSNHDLESALLNLFSIIDLMKKEDKSESKPKVSEYLPKCGVVVDLYSPEEMSIDQLLEIFERRGFKSLVSNVNTLEQIVNLYYDHLMPKYNRDEWITNDELTAPTSVDTFSNDNNTTNNTIVSSNDLPNKKSDSNQPNERKRTANDLDNLVITYDVKRFTPSCSIKTSNSPSNEHNLTVIYPKKSSVKLTNSINNQSVCNTLSNEQIPKDNVSKTVSSIHSIEDFALNNHANTTTNTTNTTNDNNTDQSLQSIKKRPKINRNFTVFTNHV